MSASVGNGLLGAEKRKENKDNGKYRLGMIYFRGFCFIIFVYCTSINSTDEKHWMLAKGGTGLRETKIKRK